MHVQQAILPAIKARLIQDGSLDEKALQELALEFNVSGAHIRGLVSFYDDLHQDPNAVRICEGTSCRLARQGKRDLGRHVYCLGRCYEAPNALAANGQILDRTVLANGHDGFRDPEEAPPCPVFCLASTPAVTRRIMNGDHATLKQALNAEVYTALKRSLQSTPSQIIDQLSQADLRGRGGAGFRVGQKWAACAAFRSDKRFAVVNGDEGDPGSFVDRVLMEQDPHAVLEGLALCAYAIGAHHGLIYVRSEYPLARIRLEQAILEAQQAGILGDSVMGSEFSLQVEVVSGMGSYVCGEETAMLQSIEGQREK